MAALFRGVSEEGGRSLRPRASGSNRSSGMLAPYEVRTWYPTGIHVDYEDEYCFHLVYIFSIPCAVFALLFQLPPFRTSDQPLLPPSRYGERRHVYRGNSWAFSSLIDSLPFSACVGFKNVQKNKHDFVESLYIGQLRVKNNWLGEAGGRKWAQTPGLADQPGDYLCFRPRSQQAPRTRLRSTWEC